MSNYERHMSNLMGLHCRVSETPSAQEEVMGLLMDSAGVDFTEVRVRELLGLPRSTTQRALKELAEQGLVTTTSVGRTLTFRVDSTDPLIRHLKIARSIARARRLVAPLGDDVETVLLFGSAARGEDTGGSDLDLFVVAATPEPVRDALARHEDVQAVVMTPAQHMELIAEGGTFAAAVSDGIRVWSQR